MRKINGILSFILAIILLFGGLAVFSDETSEPTTEAEETTKEPEPEKKKILTSVQHIRSAMMIDVETGMTVYSHASPIRTYPAVTTKMMVALVVLDKMGNNLGTEITAPGNIASIQRGAHIELVGGEVIKARDLLTALVMNNANDAAYTFALYISGSVDDFVELMNKKAEDLGMRSTKYVNVTDADETGAYTTAEDVMILARELFNNNTYTEMAKLTTYTIEKTNKKSQRKIYTRNYLLSKLIYPDYYMKEATGLCAGSSIMGGYCTIASAKIADRDYICVVMDGEVSSEKGHYSFIAAREILTWASNKHTYKTLLDNSRLMGEIKVRLAEEYDWVGVVPKGEITVYMPKNINVDEVTEYKTEIYYNVLTAPVAEGEEVGTVRVYYEGNYVGTLPLVTKRGLGQSKTEKNALILSDIVTSKPFVVSVITCAAILVVGIFARSAWLYRKRISIDVEYQEE